MQQFTTLLNNIISNLTSFVVNNASELVFAGIVLLATYFVFFVLKGYIYGQLRRFDSHELIDALADRLNRLGFLTSSVTGFYFISQIFGELPVALKTLGYFMFILIWTWQGIMLISRVIDYAAKSYLRRNEAESNTGVIRFLANGTKIIIWLLAILLILSNLGYDVNSLVAGLGISGIAVALAVQAVLGDLISSFSIVIDKPFKVGDFIIVSELMGTVNKIGIRSTRITSINGEQIIMPNSELVNSNIRNYGVVHKRRSLHTIGVMYDTDPKLMPEIPEMLKTILRENEKVEQHSFRAHLVEFADSSINFEVHFYVLTSEYKEYLDVQQEILLAIKDKFDAEGIEMAYPTQTVYINNSSK